MDPKRFQTNYLFLIEQWIAKDMAKLINEYAQPRVLALSVCDEEFAVALDTKEVFVSGPIEARFKASAISLYLKPDGISMLLEDGQTYGGDAPGRSEINRHFLVDGHGWVTVGVTSWHGPTRLLCDPSKAVCVSARVHGSAWVDIEGNAYHSPNGSTTRFLMKNAIDAQINGQLCVLQKNGAVHIFDHVQHEHVFSHPSGFKKIFAARYGTFALACNGDLYDLKHGSLSIFQTGIHNAFLSSGFMLCLSAKGYFFLRI